MSPEPKEALEAPFEIGDEAVNVVLEQPEPAPLCEADDPYWYL